MRGRILAGRRGHAAGEADPAPDARATLKPVVVDGLRGTGGAAAAPRMSIQRMQSMRAGPAVHRHRALALGGTADGGTSRAAAGRLRAAARPPPPGRSTSRRGAARRRRRAARAGPPARPPSRPRARRQISAPTLTPDVPRSTARMCLSVCLRAKVACRIMRESIAPSRRCTMGGVRATDARAGMPRSAG